MPLAMALAVAAVALLALASGPTPAHAQSLCVRAVGFAEWGGGRSGEGRRSEAASVAGRAASGSTSSAASSSSYARTPSREPPTMCEPLLAADASRSDAEAGALAKCACVFTALICKHRSLTIVDVGDGIAAATAVAAVAQGADCAVQGGGDEIGRASTCSLSDESVAACLAPLCKEKCGAGGSGSYAHSRDDANGSAQKTLCDVCRLERSPSSSSSGPGARIGFGFIGLYSAFVAVDAAAGRCGTAR